MKSAENHLFAPKVRINLPNGLFPGASKAIYDALYLKNIGAVVPKRTIQATRKELLKWSGIKNIKTINAHLGKLKKLGLIQVTNFVGEQTGSYYEVFLLGEGNPDQTQTAQTKGRPEVNPKTVWVRSGKTTEDNRLSLSVKTSFKTNPNNDDEIGEVFAVLNNKLKMAAERLTGKKISRKESEK